MWSHCVLVETHHLKGLSLSFQNIITLGQGYSSYGCWNLFPFPVVLSKFEQTPLALCRAGATVVSSTPDKELLDNVMGRLRERASQRRVLAKPCFQDFDRSVCGVVCVWCVCVCVVCVWGGWWCVFVGV